MCTAACKGNCIICHEPPKRHVHAELIKQWADNPNLKFEWRHHCGTEWHRVGGAPVWNESLDYRIKPEPKPDVTLFSYVELNGMGSMHKVKMNTYGNIDNVKYTYDGETGKLKNVEIVK